MNKKNILSGIAGLALMLGAGTEAKAQTSIKKVDAVSAQTLFNVPDAKGPAYGLSVTVPFSDKFKSEVGFYVTNREFDGDMHEDHINQRSFIRANGTSLNGYYHDRFDSDMISKLGFVVQASDDISVKVGALGSLTNSRTVSYSPQQIRLGDYGNTSYLNIDGFYAGARFSLFDNWSADVDTGVMKGFDGSYKPNFGAGVTFNF